MIDVDGQTETRYYYHYDGLGSVIALSNTNGDIVEAYSYDVFGTPTIYTAVGADGLWRTGDDTTASVSAIDNPYMFTGRRYDDESGLYYYRARMYAPDLGRFMQTDPIGYADGINWYAYCDNNPVTWADPYGLCEKKASDTLVLPNGEVIQVPQGYDPLEQAKASRNIDPLTWYNNVKSGGDWDWKRHGHKDMEITYPEWEGVGNFDYGVTGSAQGFPSWLLHWGARGAGGGTDEPKDTEWINQGIQWYKENKHLLPKKTKPDTYWSPTANMPMPRPR